MDFTGPCLPLNMGKCWSPKMSLTRARSKRSSHYEPGPRAPFPKQQCQSQDEGGKLYMPPGQPDCSRFPALLHQLRAHVHLIPSRFILPCFTAHWGGEPPYALAPTPGTPAWRMLGATFAGQQPPAHEQSVHPISYTSTMPAPRGCSGHVC